MLNRTAHVVGRGIIGLSLAYELSKRGWRVVVVGPKALPGSATRVAVGVSSIKGKTRAKQPLLAAKMLGHYGIEAWIADVQERSGRQIRHRFGVLFEPFSSLKEFDWIRERVFHKEFTGCLNVELLSQDRFREKGLPEHLRKDSWQGAFRYPDDGFVHPDDLLDALEAALTKDGATFIEDSVHRLEGTNGETVLLHTERTTLEAQTVIVACGIFSNEILSASGLRGFEQRPVPGGTLVAQGEGPDCDVALRVGKVNYVRAGSEIRAGSTPFDGIPGDLESVCRDAFGELKKSVQKNGTRGRFRDRLPAIGQIFFPGRQTGPWVSIGYYKNGIQLSHLFAQYLASLIENATLSQDVRPFLTSRFGAFSAPSG